jgi:DNA-binding LacI/PurR family transcriptional regulator
MGIKLSEVAELAGVSLATASRVLNGKNGVAAATRDAVLAASVELGYARPRVEKRRVVGLVLPELENPIFATFAQRLATLVAQNGDTPAVCTQTGDGILEDEWIEMLLERDLAGLVVVSGMHADTHASADRYERLRQLQIPLVLVNGYVEDLDAAFVSDDDRSAMHLAVDHLVSLGHRRLGLALGPERYVPVIRKREGFLDAAEAAGVEVEVVHSLFSVEGGRAAALELLEAGTTAIVCASDVMALGALRACTSRRLRVPRDVSVIGYDDSTVAAFTGPPLTTIRQSVPAMAKAAVHSVLEQLSGHPPSPHELLFQPELVVRGSTGAAPDTPRRRA